MKRVWKTFLVTSCQQNADGLRNYCERYGHTIYNISNDLGPIPTAWKMETEEDKAEVPNSHFRLLNNPLEYLTSLVLDGITKASVSLPKELYSQVLPGVLFTSAK